MDLVPNGDKIHQALKAVSGQNSVPNTYIGGTHVGGCDDVMAKGGNGKLKDLLNGVGATHTF